MGKERGEGPEHSARLLTGGNPQIAKGEGEAPVLAYIEALSGWQREVCAGLDAAVVAAVPGVKKAVKWNSPFYGTDAQGWFLSFHVMTRYVKVAFFAGASLQPMPPEPSKDPNTRYLHVSDKAPLEPEQFADWVRQASRLKGFGAP